MEVQRYASLALAGLCFNAKSGLDDSNRVSLRDKWMVNAES